MEEVKYKVQIIRNYSVLDVIDVVAENEGRAEQKAVDISNNKDYSSQLQLGDVEATVLETEPLIPEQETRLMPLIQMWLDAEEKLRAGNDYDCETLKQDYLNIYRFLGTDDRKFVEEYLNSVGA